MIERSSGVALGALAVMTVVVRSASAMDIEHVLARQHRSLGDTASLRTLSLDVRMEEPDRAFDLRIRFARPGAMRVDLYRLGVPVYSEGFGRSGPWQQHLLQWSPRPTSAAGGDAIRNGVEGFTWGRSLAEMRERGHGIELIDSPGNAGKIGVRVRFRTGSVRLYFLDPETFRIVRTQQEFALHPDMEGSAGAVRPIDSSWLDYREIGGLALPMRIVNRDGRTGEVVQTVSVCDVRLNQPFDPRIFDGR